MPGPGRDRPVVGEADDPCGGRPAMGVDEQVEAEGLRRLDGAQARSLRRRGDGAGRIDRGDGVGDRNARDRGAAIAGRGDGAIDQRRRDEGPGRIMDEDKLGASAARASRPAWTEPCLVSAPTAAGRSRSPSRKGVTASA